MSIMRLSGVAEKAYRRNISDMWSCKAMHEDRPLGQPSDYYLKVCARGYLYFDFDVNRLIQAVYDSQEE